MGGGPESGRALPQSKTLRISDHADPFIGLMPLFFWGALILLTLAAAIPNPLAEVRQSAGAVAEALHRRVHAIEHREVEIGHRRVRGMAEMTAGREGASAVAR